MKTLKASALISFALFMITSSAQAALTIDFSQVGSDVVVTASGDINVSGLAPGSTFAGPATYISATASFDRLISSSSASIPFYQLPTTYNLFQNDLVSTEFGTPTGQDFGLYSNAAGTYVVVYVPSAFFNGSLSGTATFDDLTLAALGVTPMPLLTWGGSSSQGIKVTVNGVVPEPSTTALLLGGISLLVVAVVRRRMKSYSARSSN